jgi:PhoH-like ATPase
MKNRKILIVDTSVLLYDMKSIHSFPGNDVVLPLIILDELDRFKDKPGLLGESARYVNRLLDGLREYGKLNEGITLSDSNQSIRVEIRAPNVKELVGLDYSRGDNRIIASAVSIQNENPGKQVKVITKDINLRVKCEAVGIKAEDYFNDHLDIKDEEYSGWKNIFLNDIEVDTFYKDSFLELEEKELNDLYENQFVVSKSENKSFLAMYKKQNLSSLKHTVSTVIKLEPKNKEQKFAIEALMDFDIPLVTLTGLAGSGKTYLTLMCALEGIHTEKYDRIVITRSIQPVGRDLGYLPGDLQDKMDPWLAPIVDNIRTAFKDTTYFDMMIEKGKIEIAPLSYIRGRTFNNSFVIVDEAQNATIHELKTIITRVGMGSKVVLLGDTDQIDTPYINKKSNGLSNVIEKFKSSKNAAHIKLERGQRSEIASEASKIL